MNGRGRAGPWKTWRVPLVLGLLTLTSLLGALVTEGAWDSFATVVLFGVLAFAVAKGLARRGP